MSAGCFYDLRYFDACRLAAATSAIACHQYLSLENFFLRKRTHRDTDSSPPFGCGGLVSQVGHNRSYVKMGKHDITFLIAWLEKC